MIYNMGQGGGASSADKISYDNTESQLQATDVQGAIDEVTKKPSVSPNRININSYNSKTNYFTCPNDGYVIASATYGNVNNYCIVSFVDNDYIQAYAYATTTRGLSIPIYVHKGDKVYVSGLSNGNANYVPLVYEE